MHALHFSLVTNIIFVVYIYIYSLYNHAIERERFLRDIFEIVVKSLSSVGSCVDQLGYLLIVRDKD